MIMPGLVPISHPVLKSINDIGSSISNVGDGLKSIATHISFRDLEIAESRVSVYLNQLKPLISRLTTVQQSLHQQNQFQRKVMLLSGIGSRNIGQMNPVPHPARRTIEDLTFEDLDNMTEEEKKKVFDSFGFDDEERQSQNETVVLGDSQSDDSPGGPNLVNGALNEPVATNQELTSENGEDLTNEDEVLVQNLDEIPSSTNNSSPQKASQRSSSGSASDDVPVKEKSKRGTTLKLQKSDQQWNVAGGSRRRNIRKVIPSSSSSSESSGDEWAPSSRRTRRTKESPSKDWSSKHSSGDSPVAERRVSSRRKKSTARKSTSKPSQHTSRSHREKGTKDQGKKTNKQNEEAHDQLKELFDNEGELSQQSTVGDSDDEENIKAKRDLLNFGRSSEKVTTRRKKKTQSSIDSDDDLVAKAGQDKLKVVLSSSLSLSEGDQINISDIPSTPDSLNDMRLNLTNSKADVDDDEEPNDDMDDDVDETDTDEMDDAEISRLENMPSTSTVQRKRSFKPRAAKKKPPPRKKNKSSESDDSDAVLISDSEEYESAASESDDKKKESVKKSIFPSSSENEANSEGPDDEDSDVPDSEKTSKPKVTQPSKAKQGKTSSKSHWLLKEKLESSSDEEGSNSGSEDRHKKKQSKRGDRKKTGEKKKQQQQAQKRRRVKLTKSSSSESDGSKPEALLDDDELTPGKKHKKLRKILKRNELETDTKSAAKAEKERRKRIADRQKEFNWILMEEASAEREAPVVKQLILEHDKDKKSLIEVVPELCSKLKPHQADAIKFMWECCFESLERLKTSDGGGCILAHCMGLGKSLSAIALVHALMLHQDLTKIKTCLVVCPLNTVLNWRNEWEMWLEDCEFDIDVFETTQMKDNRGRADILGHWHRSGGVFIIGYEMFRNLTLGKSMTRKKFKGKPLVDEFKRLLCDPGADFVICDEGHMLKNSETALSKCIREIRSRRRVVLTGTPLQNNLIEYHCMVDFIKPNLLGTKKEYQNRFVNPILNGQHVDSTPHDVRLMKRRAHVLHETLAGCVQRRDYSVLVKFLPPKFEYVLSVRMSDLQVELYQTYLDTNVNSEELGKGGRLFSDYQNLQCVFTHPYVLVKRKLRRDLETKSDDSMDEFINDDGEDDKSDTGSNSSSDVEVIGSDGELEWKPKKADRDRIEKEAKEARERKLQQANGEEVVPVRSWTPSAEDRWWQDKVTDDMVSRLELSGKLVIVMEILKKCEEIGDKVLLFSHSLFSLSMIEDFLYHFTEKEKEKDHSALDRSLAEFAIGHWEKGIDYFRLDGSTDAKTRKRDIQRFNSPKNLRGRLFIVSTRAGGLGINMIAANRVIIFDASWNPSHDIQAIFRSYRFGQIKPVYVYRLLAQGTMEEKIYERQVTKQSLSQRVVDEHQIDRHFSAADLKELYRFKPDIYDEANPGPLPVLPKDRVLAELLSKDRRWILKYHEHDSLLENRPEQDLTEEEKKVAWEEFETEKSRPALSYPTHRAVQPLSVDIQQRIGRIAYQISVLYPQRASEAMRLSSMIVSQNNVPLENQLNGEFMAQYPHYFYGAPAPQQVQPPNAPTGAVPQVSDVINLSG